MGSTEYRASFAPMLAADGRLPRIIARAQPPDHGQPAAVLAFVKDKPSAALKKRVPDRRCARTATGNVRSG